MFRLFRLFRLIRVPHPFRLPQPTLNWKWLLISAFFASWIVFFTYFWANSIYTDHEGNIVVTNVNIWGDWAAHFTMGSHLANRNLIPDTSPLLINQAFSYPFAADWLSAALYVLGVPFFTSFVMPSWFFSILLVFGLAWFYKTLFKSWTITLLATSLFLFNGGLGFVHFFVDIAASSSPSEVLLNPPREYTNLEPLFYRWISVVQSMVVPQRAFTMGFPMALVAITLLLKLYQSNHLEKKKALLAGVIIGLLPLVHTHSFLAVCVIVSLWGVTHLAVARRKERWKMLGSWALAGIPALAISLPIIWWLFFRQISSHFISWFPGWYSHQFPELSWWVFWFKNWWLVPLFAIVGWWVHIARAHTIEGRWKSVWLFAPFFILFILLNLFLFQPFIWDNTKLLVWVSLGFSGLTAFLFTYLWKKKSQLHWLPKMLGRGILSILVFITIFSGLIDTYRIIRFRTHTYEMYSAEELALAEWARTQTARDSVWLTGDKHNNWLYNLTGRQSMLTFRGWLWTHGYDYHDIERDVSTLFQRPAQNEYLFEKYGIDYIIISHNERNVWGAKEEEFKRLFPIVQQTPSYLVFERKSQ